MPTTGTSGGARAVDRAADLLVRVLSADEPVHFPDLVEATGLPKSTVSRLLASLERGGLVARAESGAVVAGPAVTRFARTHRWHDELRALARPALDRLGAETGETINLAVPTPSGVVQIDQVDPRFLLGAVNWVEREVPYHCSALGKALLAEGCSVPSGALTRLTDRTLTSRATLEADLVIVRQRGYAVADGELEPGLVAIAAAVLEDGRPIAALSVSGPDTRITPTHVRPIGESLVREARRLSAQLTPSGKAGAA